MAPPALDGQAAATGHRSANGAKRPWREGAAARVATPREAMSGVAAFSRISDIGAMQDLWDDAPITRTAHVGREYRGRDQKHQQRTAAELDALLPAILDRAFKAEL